ncbi:hypothetical protein [uncultured Anaerobiospirillum sp.]|uniref:hypothetical protein n=1 Tax=uncultured Anaerobiospirillum sp. TaxID=265728 RepID=UPI002804B032|nr:hypothetical protein [uncultured Anaerobiospirillum sp.]
MVSRYRLHRQRKELTVALTIPSASTAQGTNRGTHDAVSKRAEGTNRGSYDTVC